MQVYINKLQAVRDHFNNGDSHIGFRKLVDCVLDTQSSDYYKKCIALTEWKETHDLSEEALKERVFELIDDLSAAQFTIRTTGNTLLRAENINKRYGSGFFRLENISLEIKEGDVWGLVGENGNGKTTLLRILAKDLSYDSGRLEYVFQAADDYELRTRLTYIPQRTPKWYGSLKDNLKFAAVHYGIKGEENELIVLMMIIRFGLWKYKDFNWNQLSSGYKMRFELARTFLRRPDILLLDEPLANLDILAQQLILEDLKNLSQSLSHPLGIILSSQQLFEVEKVSDKLLFLKQGKPTHLKNANEEVEQGEVKTYYVEMDIESDREHLQRALSELDIKEVSFNGGIYVVAFHDEDGMYALLNALIRHRIVIRYIRDISQSTRRLFV